LAGHADPRHADLRCGRRGVPRLPRPRGRPRWNPALAGGRTARGPRDPPRHGLEEESAGGGAASWRRRIAPRTRSGKSARSLGAGVGGTVPRSIQGWPDMMVSRESPAARNSSSINPGSASCSPTAWPFRGQSALEPAPASRSPASSRRAVPESSSALEPSIRSLSLTVKRPRLTGRLRHVFHPKEWFNWMNRDTD